ncbi:MAG: helix-turn-helix domain-containing protein, partial [Candidatus Kapaibacterium sp.]
IAKTAAKTYSHTADAAEREAGSRHKRARTEHLGMSVATYAKRMKVSPVTVYAWESGTRRIPHEVLSVLESRYGVSTSWLLNGTEPMLLESAQQMQERIQERIQERMQERMQEREDDSSAWDQLSVIRAAVQEAGDALASLSRRILTLDLARTRSTRFPLMESVVSAGPPVSTSDAPVNVDIVDFLVSNPDSTFFVNVIGDSMKDIGIYDGDTLIIDRSITPKSGEIIVARVFNELTVKRFVRNGKRVILAAENRAHKNIEVTEDMDFSIIGVVTTSIKKFRH